jgi:hypothetical protein
MERPGTPEITLDSPEPECEEDWEKWDCDLDEDLEGLCAIQSRVCIDGFWSDCAPAFVATTEICNGLDDNCDGDIDELKPLSCEPENAVVGVYNRENPSSTCLLGAQECINGNWTECVGWIGPEPEICDTLDNNCNTIVDDIPDYLLGECGYSYDGESYFGICSNTGVERCIDGDIVCLGQTTPSAAEACNGIDDTCNDVVDEGLVRLCQSDCGSQGFEYCSEGEWINCDAPGCECTPGETKYCLSDPCGFGIQRCIDGYWEQECDFLFADEEVCNNHDDDCNELIDDDPFTESGYLEEYCYEGEPPETAGVGVCEGGFRVCDGGDELPETGGWGSCEGQVLPVLERCNDRDDDCDGLADNRVSEEVKYDICFFVDISASITPLEMEGIVNAIINIAIAADSDHRYCLVVFGGEENGGDGFIVQNIGTIEELVGGLGIMLLLSAGAVEPGYDVLYDALAPFVPGASNSIRWRSSYTDFATPIFILFSDEEPQSTRGLGPSDVIPRSRVCGVASCNNPPNVFWANNSPAEIFLFVEDNAEWSELVFAEGDRVFDLTDALSAGVDIGLEIIFRQICAFP